MEKRNTSTNMDLVEDARKGEEVSTSMVYDESETKKVLRKVDWRLLPMLTLLYVLSFIDRSNSAYPPEKLRVQACLADNVISWKCQSRGHEQGLGPDRNSVQHRVCHILSSPSP